MKMDKNHDPIWAVAWEWVGRKRGRGGLDDAALAELRRWLIADPIHRKTFDEASRLWSLVNLIPPANDIPLPESDDLKDF
jgi:ferric-dicitrate binding protein FerR (iron transport regulator)